MLVASLLALTTPASHRLRRLGYVRESSLLQARSRRCRRAWAPHLARARNTVVEAALACPDRRLAVVLGSGLLDDVPLDILARTFDRVRLVDAVHPWPARLAVHRHRHVDLVTAEISAGLCEPAFAQAVEGASLVVSANVLSQLAILPVDAFGRAGRDVPPALGVTIVEAHLAALSALARRGARICLITDTVQREEDREGRILSTLDLLAGVTLPPPASAWDWELAPFGEASRDRRTVHRVQAYPAWGGNRRPPDAC